MDKVLVEEPQGEELNLDKVVEIPSNITEKRRASLKLRFKIRSKSQPDVVEVASKTTEKTRPSLKLKLKLPSKSQPDVAAADQPKQKRRKLTSDVDKKKKTVCYASLKKFKSLKLRNTPKPFNTAIKALSSAQKKKVIDMGFGSLLGSNCSGMPTKLGYFVVDNFDSKSMQLRLPNGNIQITPELIHHIYGIPCGGTAVNCLVVNDSETQCYVDWHSQFVKDLRPSDIVRKIEESEDDGMVFVLNFIILFVNSMVECIHNGSCKIDLLERFDENVDFKSVDWCGYIYESLKKCKVSWKRDDVGCYFTGPITFLILLYLDATSFKQLDTPINVPAINFWTVEMMEKREIFEIDCGGFGHCQIKNLTQKQVVQEESKLELIKLVEDIERKLASFIDAKIDLELLLSNAIPKFPECEILKQKKKLLFEILKMNTDFEVDTAGIRPISDDHDDACAKDSFVQDNVEDVVNDVTDEVRNEKENNYNYCLTEGVDKNVDVRNEAEDYFGFMKDGLTDSLFQETVNDEVGDLIGVETYSAGHTVKGSFVQDNVEDAFDDVLVDFMDTVFDDAVNDVADDVMDEVLNGKEKNNIYCLTEGVNKNVDVLNEEAEHSVGFMNDGVADVQHVQLVNEMVERDVDSVKEIEVNFKIVVLDEKGKDQVDVVSSSLKKNALKDCTTENIVEDSINAVIDQKIMEIVLDGQNEHDNFEIFQDDEVVNEEDFFDASVAIVVFSHVVKSDNSIQEVVIVNEPEPIDVRRPNQPTNRVVQVKQNLRSPYRNKKVDIESEITQEESKISFALFSMLGDPSDIVFSTEENDSVHRVYMETLTPGIRVHKFVIDLWSKILNAEERVRSTSSPRRFFFQTDLIGDDIFIQGVSYKKKSKVFKKNIRSAMKNDDGLLSFKNIDLVFVPIVQSEHFYLLVLNLQNPEFLILDNIYEGGVDIYGELPNLVLELFCEHFSTVGHKSVYEFDFPIPVKVKFPWRTKENLVDNGVFVMCHMDTYLGECYKTWHCGLNSESDDQQDVLNELRGKYATKILLSDLNLRRNDFIKLAEEFDEVKFNEVKKIFDYGFQNWPSRCYGHI